MIKDTIKRIRNLIIIDQKFLTTGIRSIHHRLSSQAQWDRQNAETISRYQAVKHIRECEICIRRWIDLIFPYNCQYNQRRRDARALSYLHVYVRICAHVCMCRDNQAYTCARTQTRARTHTDGDTHTYTHSRADARFAYIRGIHSNLEAGWQIDVRSRLVQPSADEYFRCPASPVSLRDAARQKEREREPASIYRERKGREGTGRSRALANFRPEMTRERRRCRLHRWIFHLFSFFTVSPSANDDESNFRIPIDCLWISGNYVFICTCPSSLAHRLPLKGCCGYKGRWRRRSSPISSRFASVKISAVRPTEINTVSIVRLVHTDFWHYRSIVLITLAVSRPTSLKFILTSLLK